MSIDRAAAADWARAYGSTWAAWDIAGFLDLFSEDVVYLEHPTGEAVVGRAALDAYVREEEREQGDVTVRIGSPVVDGNRVAGEFWAAGEDGAIAGGFIALLDATGRCTMFREYWFEIEEGAEPPEGWGT